MIYNLEDLVDSKVDPDILLLVPDFIKNREQDLQSLQHAYSRKDYDTIAKVCHRLKSFSRPYGFETLEDLSRQLEVAAITANDAEVSILFNQVRSYIHDKSQKLSRLSRY